MGNPILIHWEDKEEPTEEYIRKILTGEGLKPFRWANDPGDTYAPHSHPYYKIFYVIEGSLTFHYLEDGVTYEVQPGDRIEVFPKEVHKAEIGPNGVVCLEAHKKMPKSKTKKELETPD